MSDPDVDLDPVASLYGANLKEFGAEARALGWKSRDEQKLRFDILTRHIDLAQPLDLIDYGCGFADLLPYMIEERTANLIRYTGYEINAELGNVAADRLLDTQVPGAIVNSSALENVADWAVVSGTFNVRLGNDSMAWEESVRQTLRDLFQSTRVGVSFNLLSTYVDWRADGLFYADPLEFFDFCKTELSPRVSLDHHYPLYEWTMTVFH